MSTPPLNHSVQLERFIKAPPERVFAAWTNPAQLRQWFGPGACEVLAVETDVRVGGAYRIEVRSESQGVMSVRGEYREVNAPTRLVFTWQWEDDEDWKDVTSVVTVECVAKDRGTEVRITHDGLPSAEHAGRHQHGWSGGLDKLAARADAMVELNGPGQFSWNELLTSDPVAAGAFYRQLLGWKPAAMAGSDHYTLFEQNGISAGGMMKSPMPGIPPHWLAYVTVESCDATAAQVVKLGGAVCREPFDIPTVGRIAVVQDPQGAVFGLFQMER